MPTLSGPFVLPLSSGQDHTCDMRVPADPLLHLLWLLLLQRTAGGAVDIAHLLDWTHPTDGRQIPTRKCKGKKVVSLKVWEKAEPLITRLFQFCHVMLQY